MNRLAPLLALALAACSGGSDVFVVGSKPFTESEIVGEIVAQLAEAEGAKVERKYYMGGVVCFQSLRTGNMDAYVEYTGTGLVSLLNEPASSDRAKVYRRVKDEFQKRWDLRWMPPLGFNNTYALAMRKDHARRLGLAKMSELKGKKLRCGFDEVFLDRPDGYRGMVEHYGMEFCAETKQMNPGLMYQALADGHVDVISSYSTDGRIRSLGLVTLEDDLAFFPPYEAAPLLGPDAFRKAPGLEARLESLAGRITDAEMIRMNAEVDERKRPARDVAKEFLERAGLL